MELVDIKKIVPDPNQPRKFFDAEKLFTLQESIKKQGIINSLVVEDQEDGTYLLIDGERRYRAAKEIGLKQVPVSIQKKGTATERLIKQFEVQEQQESWTPIEKANALIELSREMKLPLAQVCQILNVPRETNRRYIAFAQLADREAYVTSGLPLQYTPTLQGFKQAVITLKEKKGEAFGIDAQKALEARMVRNIQAGIITKTSDMTRLKDAVTKDPKALDLYLKDQDMTPATLFHKTNAMGAYNLRNLMANARYVASHANRFLQIKDVTISKEQVSQLKYAKGKIEEVLALAE